MTRPILILATVLSLVLLRLAGDEIADATWVVSYGVLCAWLGRTCDRVTGGETGDPWTETLAPMTIHRPGDLRLRLLGNALTRLR